jgi:hypothetical protein
LVVTTRKAKHFNAAWLSRKTLAGIHPLGCAGRRHIYMGGIDKLGWLSTITWGKISQRPAAQPAAQPVIERFSISNLVAMAGDTNTAAITLAGLASHPDSRVRLAVADNKGTPIEIIRKLAADESDDLRFALAENHNIAIDVLLTLAQDKNPYVAVRAERTLARIQKARLSAFQSYPIVAKRIVS